MTKDSKHVKCQNGVQNHLNGEPLPVLDPQIKGYDPVELYQWEMCVQFCCEERQRIIPRQMYKISLRA
eukprot:2153908-Ditylum_brightwellii.AAC.1